MYQFRFVLGFTIFLACISCDTRNSLEHTKKEINPEKLLGQWKSSEENSLQEDDISITAIRLEEDGVVELILEEPSGSRKVTGKWKTSEKKVITNRLAKVETTADLSIEFDLSKNHRYKMYLEATENNGRIMLNGHKVTFEKEEFNDVKKL